MRRRDIGREIAKGRLEVPAPYVTAEVVSVDPVDRTIGIAMAGVNGSLVIPAVFDSYPAVGSTVLVLMNGDEPIVLGQTGVGGGTFAVPGQTVRATVVGTSYTPVAADKGALTPFSSSSAITLTLPRDTDLLWGIGEWAEFVQLGTGLLSPAAGTGATWHGAVSSGQYGRLFVQKYAPDTWLSTRR